MLRKKIKKILRENVLIEEKYTEITLEDSFAYERSSTSIFETDPFGTCKLNGTHMEYAITLETLLDLETGDYTNFLENERLYIIATQNSKILNQEYITIPPFNKKIYMSLDTKILKNETISFYIYLKTDRRVVGRILLNAKVI